MRAVKISIYSGLGAKKDKFFNLRMLTSMMVEINNCKWISIVCVKKNFYDYHWQVELVTYCRHDHFCIILGPDPKLSDKKNTYHQKINGNNLTRRILTLLYMVLYIVLSSCLWAFVLFGHTPIMASSSVPRPDNKTKMGEKLEKIERKWEKIGENWRKIRENEFLVPVSGRLFFSATLQ